MRVETAFSDRKYPHMQTQYKSNFTTKEDDGMMPNQTAKNYASRGPAAGFFMLAHSPAVSVDAACPLCFPPCLVPLFVSGINI